jgi:hypothetical protein
MTEPTPLPPEDQLTPAEMMRAVIPLHFNAHPTPGPDGKMWVGIVFASGNVIAEVRVGDELADAIADGIPAAIHEAAANARRANLGLIIPGNGANLSNLDLSKMRDPGSGPRG